MTGGACGLKTWKSITSIKPENEVEGDVNGPDPVLWVDQEALVDVSLHVLTRHIV